MQLCTGISIDRHELFICSTPEPAVALVCSNLIESTLDWSRILSELNLYQSRMDVNVGSHGEVACQILRIMAHDVARSRVHGWAAGRVENDHVLPPVKFTDFLKVLLGDKLYDACKQIRQTTWDRKITNELKKDGGSDRIKISRENWTNGLSTDELLSNAYCRTVQYSRSYSVPNLNYISQMFYRANGMMCKPNYPGMDCLDPLLLVPPGSRTYRM
jgi:hypothetical protein